MMALSALNSTATPEVRLLEDADAPAMRALFAEVFREDMSQAFWNWKYRQARGCAVGVFMDGELVGHYGGVGADIVCKGKPAKAVQIVDVMVKSSARRLVRKKSPFYLAGSFFLERFIGYDNPYLLGYGFPSDRHMALAERMEFYAPVGRMHELTWQLAAPIKGPGLLHKLVSIDAGNLARHAPALDALWQGFLPDLRDYIAVRKDAAFVNRRYLQNPDKRYLPYLLVNRLTGRALGLIVLKVEAERVLLMDYVGPLRNLDRLLQCALFQTAALQRGTLSTWCCEIFTERFKTTGAISTALPITTPANIWTAGPAPAELQDRWWLMPGDTDFL